MAIHPAQDVLDQGGQVRGQSRLPRLWHLAEVYRPHPLTTAISHRDGRGGPLLPFAVAQRHIGTITAHGKRRLHAIPGQ
jgi:hypothetical protein